MRKGLLGSIAALAAGAGAAWGQSPIEPGAPPTGVPGVGAPAPLGGPSPFGPPPGAAPGGGPFAPGPVIMPPGNYGPADDPLGLGPVGGFGPPPSPMYPMPGPYGAQSYQPAPNGGGGGLGSAPQWWVDGEYLLWFTKGQPVRYPLLTSSAPADMGVLGAASTVALVDRGTLGYNAMSGMRLSAGFFGDADRRFGFNLTGFFTERRSNIQDFGGLGNFSGVPVLARPFVDANQATSTIVLSSADFGPASVQVGTSTSTFSIEPSAVWNLYRSAPGARKAWSLDFLAGYRFFQLKEDLWVDSLTALNSGLILPIFQTGPFGVVTRVGTQTVPNQASFGGVIIQTPAFVNVRDSFRATNNFNGASFGLRTEARCGIVSASASAKVSIGNLHQRLDIFGGSSFVDFTGVSGSQINNTVARGTGGGAGGAYGGVLANASNIGTYTDDRFTYMPEFGGTIGIAFTKGLTGYVGVNFLYLPDVLRPGNQVNPVVSSAAIPFGSNYGTAGAVRSPGVTLDQSDYWLGGVTFGLQVRY
ncbi:BBP7 family outer membrane beta-barrel protein [Gemmata sp. G18]|uniref:BBP7 family outer membrane beta-barrel protein n=1 Tax=Gemmata palustris TaxID=2822762 RepID=A0ABS5C1Y0_9BACT|nr:BBP7 family outer membrane beta-barrel protein [Gemmata palustris]MBP3959928.1 BBP7 family outer membrane beta-barrel protein [Gemmata palustris]